LTHDIRGLDDNELRVSPRLVPPSCSDLSFLSSTKPPPHVHPVLSLLVFISGSIPSLGRTLSFSPCFPRLQHIGSTDPWSLFLQGLVHWKKFFADHKTYFKVGAIKHVPIDPASPIPGPCKSPKSGDGNPATSTDEKGKEAKEEYNPRSAPNKGETTRDGVREEL
jgi:hypothetical protein